MIALRQVPEIHEFKTCNEFLSEFTLNKTDLIITTEQIYIDYLKDNSPNANVVFLSKYGNGEPNSDMIEEIIRDIQPIEFNRVIGIGGGSVLDASKLFILEQVSPVLSLFKKEIPRTRQKELVLVPTTCGSGSEVSNSSILEFTNLHAKYGLCDDALYAKEIVLVPEFLKTLPFNQFMTSSVDAFIHAMESYLSPKATKISDMYSLQAIKTILRGYCKISKQGEDERKELLEDFLYASLYAGIAVNHSGAGTVHAMSNPVSVAFKIPHGEANNLFFIPVFQLYEAQLPEGKIHKLNKYMSKVMDCKQEQAMPELTRLLQQLLPSKALKEYGAPEKLLDYFTVNVIQNQKRLLSNSYVPMNYEMIFEIYKGRMD